MNVMPKASWVVEEGDVKISDVAGNVFIEIDGDAWYCSVTLKDDAIVGLHEWLTLYRQARGL